MPATQEDILREFLKRMHNDDVVDLQIEVIKGELRPMLAALNQSIANKDKVVAADSAQNLAAVFEQLRPLAGSNESCNDTVNLMKQIAEALTAIDPVKTVRAVQAAEALLNKYEVTSFDFEAFKHLAFS